MVNKGQPSLIETFETARPANSLFCHQDFLEKLAGHSRDAIGKRATFLLQRLCVDAQRLHYKATQGVNRGWRRSRLGGNHGSHFYAWWAPKHAAPLKESDEFAEAPEGAIFLRDIRHHDDHSPLSPQSLENHYLPVSVRDIRREEYGPQPWTPAQLRFAAGRQTVRLLKGHPGSGKTTALFNAADSASAEEILYVTYSRDLATLAREYFDRFCSSHKRFNVMTFPNLVRLILGEEAPFTAAQDAKRAFLHDLVPFSRTLGPWMGNRTALYDELHAHFAGDAIPVEAGRFEACAGPRVGERAYRKRRVRHVGDAAAKAALELAARLEKQNGRPLAESYFPELALAWRAVEKLRAARTSQNLNLIDASLRKIDCIAVDECQDLTPIESFVLIELAALNNAKRRNQVTLLLSGDEAQTVRPTDFEWGWLSDLLHSQLATPTEYKLAANLRSPRQIAEITNKVWDLYARVEKQERPSGVGYAEIDDDSTDQVLYCITKAGPDLDELLISLSGREGLALITLEETVPAYVPEAVRPSVLTVAEAKGLDFNSICLLNGGAHLLRIFREGHEINSYGDIECLRKRLAIDQLRVALSRPTERLLWVDVDPSDDIIRKATGFINGHDTERTIASVVPAALLKTLDEDALDLEERVQLCQSDARQYLDVKPGVAWSRAQQAVSLLGRPGTLGAITDEALRNAVYMTLAEVCYILASRNAKMPPELGKMDLHSQAYRAALAGGDPILGGTLNALVGIDRAPSINRLPALIRFVEVLSSPGAQLPSWLLLEIGPRAKQWADELESGDFDGRNAALLLRLLPRFYEALNIPDRDVRVLHQRHRAIKSLMKDRHFAEALTLLEQLDERQPQVEAACYEALGDYRRAADCHLAKGDKKAALTCYRSIPDLDEALKLIDQMDDHPAAESLRWVADLHALVAKRPASFTKVVLPAEKKLLENVLEQSLGVTRVKPVKKAVARKAATPRKQVVKTVKDEPKKPTPPTAKPVFMK